MSEQLRAAIKASGLTQAELSREARVPESVVSRFLAGAQLRSDNLDSICKVLGARLTTTTPRKRKGR